MSKQLRELERQLSLCHQRAASLLKQSRPGQWERNQATIQRLERQIEQQKQRSLKQTERLSL